MDLYSFFTALATVVIAAFTVVLAVVTGRQATLTRRALVTTQRAFVFLEDFDVDRDYNLGARKVVQYIVRLRWKNNGSTPTRKMIVRTNWTTWMADELPENFEYAYGGPGARMFLGPKATEWSKPIEIPSHVATEALEGTQRIFVWGRADYEDIFDGTKPHFTRWCYRAIPAVSGPELWTQFIASGDYNGTDEDERRV